MKTGLFQSCGHWWVFPAIYLGPNYGGGNEDNGDLLQNIPAILLPGESHGQRSLVGYSPWGSKGSDILSHFTAEDRIGKVQLAVQVCRAGGWQSSGSKPNPYNSRVTSHPFPSSVQLSHLVMSDFLRPMDYSTPGLPVHLQLPESTQTHILWVNDAIQPPHTLSSLSPPAFNLSQHQGLFRWVSSLHQVAKVLQF